MKRYDSEYYAHMFVLVADGIPRMFFKSATDAVKYVNLCIVNGCDCEVIRWCEFCSMDCAA